MVCLNGAIWVVSVTNYFGIRDWCREWEWCGGKGVIGERKVGDWWKTRRTREKK